MIDVRPLLGPQGGMLAGCSPRHGFTWPRAAQYAFPRTTIGAAGRARTPEHVRTASVVMCFVPPCPNIEAMLCMCCDGVCGDGCVLIRETVTNG